MCAWPCHGFPVQMEPAVSSCLLSSYAALRELDTASANQHIDKGFQYALAKWWQVKQPGQLNTPAVALQRSTALAECRLDCLYAHVLVCLVHRPAVCQGTVQSRHSCVLTQAACANLLLQQHHSGSCCARLSGLSVGWLASWM